MKGGIAIYTRLRCLNFYYSHPIYATHSKNILIRMLRKPLSLFSIPFLDFHAAMSDTARDQRKGKTEPSKKDDAGSADGKEPHKNQTNSHKG